jgi:crossover junction endodeoxyribonuclease RusA
MATTTAIWFDVRGAAEPKGSHRAFPIRRKDGSRGVAVTDSNRSVAGWTRMVQSAAQQQCGGVYFDTAAVRLAVVFYLPRPKSLPARVRAHLTRPDLDKLLRAIKDALTGLLWHDDSQVVELLARKGYAQGEPHVRIGVDYAAPVEEVTVQDNLFAELEF